MSKDKDNEKDKKVDDKNKSKAKDLLVEKMNKLQNQQIIKK